MDGMPNAIPVIGPGAHKMPAGQAAAEHMRARNRKPLRVTFRRVWCQRSPCPGHDDDARCAG